MGEKGGDKAKNASTKNANSIASIPFGSNTKIHNQEEKQGNKQNESDSYSATFFRMIYPTYRSNENTGDRKQDDEHTGINEGSKNIIGKNEDITVINCEVPVE